MDRRSDRKVKVLPFISRVECSREQNFSLLMEAAKAITPEGFEGIDWDSDVWTITKGRLLIRSGARSTQVQLKFQYPPKAGGGKLSGCWADVCKCLVVLRFHRNNQAASNQRNFITAVSYVSHAATDLGQNLVKLTPEALDAACYRISSDYAESTAYNLHRSVAEFSACCDKNGLCRCIFDFKYSGMKRPGCVAVSYTHLTLPTNREV